MGGSGFRELNPPGLARLNMVTLYRDRIMTMAWPSCQAGVAIGLGKTV
jgi:hypothetical protein